MQSNIFPTGLESRLDGIASRYQGVTTLYDADDLKQEFALHLTEKPQLFNEKPAYIAQSCRFAASHKLNKAYRRERWISSFEEMSRVELEDEELDVWEPASEALSVEERVELALSLADAIRDLSERDQQVLALFYQGYCPSEIAQLTGFSVPIISQRRSFIQKVLTRHLAGEEEPR